MASRCCGGSPRAGSRAPIVLMSGLDERVLSSASRLGQALDLDIVGAVLKPLALGDCAACSTRTREERRSSRSRPARCRRDGDADPTSGPHGVLETSALVVHYQPQCGDGRRRDRRRRSAGALAASRSGLVAPAHVSRARGAQPASCARSPCAVLRDSVRNAGAGPTAGYHVPVAVNLSPALLDDLSLPDEIERVTLEAGVRPADVTLEVTESVAIARRQLAMDVLTRLRLKGFRLALDDFGVGFSSLLELQHMPFTELKIDKSFVADAGDRPSARAIVDAVIGLGHRLSLRIVAEGIETQAAWTLVRTAGCDVGQGYLHQPSARRAGLRRLPRRGSRSRRVPRRISDDRRRTAHDARRLRPRVTHASWSPRSPRRRVAGARRSAAAAVRRTGACMVERLAQRGRGARAASGGGVAQRQAARAADRRSVLAGVQPVRRASRDRADCSPRTDRGGCAITCSARSRAVLVVGHMPHLPRALGIPHDAATTTRGRVSAATVS